MRMCAADQACCQVKPEGQLNYMQSQCSVHCDRTPCIPTWQAILGEAKVYEPNLIPGLKVICAQHDIAAGHVQMTQLSNKMKVLNGL